MARLKEIVQFINNEIEAKALKDKRFGGSQLSGIAVLTEFKKNAGGQPAMQPWVMNNEPEGMYVGIDDIHPVQVYHKHYGSVPNTPEAKENFGDKNNVITKKYNMGLIVMGQRKKIKLSPEQLETLIEAGFPDSLNAQLRNDFKLNSCMISISGTDHNSNALLKREYGQPDKKYDHQTILFEMKYLIECSYKRSCIDILCC